jgi:hypothetical protein
MRNPRNDRLRALNVPRRIEVELGDGGLPVRIRDGGRGTQKDSLSVAEDEWRVVEGIGDTWRLDDEWWRRPIVRRYVEVFLEGGGRMVLYEDLVTREWFGQTS